MIPDYYTDTYGWSRYNAQLLKEKRFDEIDLDNIIEEIISVGNSEEQQLVNILRLVIMHLLKWQFQPMKRSGSWSRTIKIQRKHARKHLNNNPSLKPKLCNILIDSYDDALYMASQETNLDIDKFPDDCPYTFEQVMDDEFFPE